MACQMHEKVAPKHGSKSTKYEREGSYGDPLHEPFRFGIFNFILDHTKYIIEYTNKHPPAPLELPGCEVSSFTSPDLPHRPTTPLALPPAAASHLLQPTPAASSLQNFKGSWRQSASRFRIF